MTRLAGRWAGKPLRRQWDLRRQVTALVVASVAVLVVVAALAAGAATVSRSHLDTLLDEVNPSQLDTERLLSAVVDQETAIRGYALNRQEASLVPYAKGIAQQREIIAHLRRLRPADRELADRLRTVEELTGQWRAQVAEPTISAVRTGDVNAGQVPGTATARRLFDSVRAAVVGLRDYLAGLRDDLAGQATRASTWLVLLLCAAAVVVLAAGAALTVLLRGMRRETAADLVVARGAHRRVEDASRQQVEDANQRLREQADELARSNRDLEQFAYVASHDLQEPLRKVASFCQLLKRRYAGQLDERADQYINFAVDGAQRMQRLINELLAFSRIGRVTTEFAEVDLDRLMSETVTGLDEARERTGAEITWSDLPVVRGEEALLGTLLANLVGNSLKFRRPGVPPRVRVSANRSGAEWELTCQDNGIGIEAEFTDKVFVIFQRLHGREAYPGTGIGLAIAERIVEYHGGRIWVDRQYADGAAVHFTLPAAKADVTAPAG